MRLAIHFDNQALRGAEEVDDERREGRLAPEFVTAEPPVR
jgi:hypothetical protein